MKALTIEQLKELQDGDWVWIEYNNGGKGYFRADESRSDNSFYVLQDGIGSLFSFNTYGKTWLAYKNKEQAECKGEIVELPYMYEYMIGSYEIVYMLPRKPNKTDERSHFQVDRFRGKDAKERAERRLAEMKGEEL